MAGLSQAVAVFEAGTQVTYHGSKTAWHGEATIVGRCHCTHCPWVERGELGTTDQRFELVDSDGHTLLHVRPQSFAIATRESEI